MRLLLFRTMWGVVDDLGKQEAAVAPLPGIAARGYDGVVAPAVLLEDAAAFAAAAVDAGLEYVPQAFTWGRTLQDHVASFRTSIEQAASLTPRPRYVICQAGRDAFDDDTARRFFREALAIEADLGLPIAFETHRQRILFTPWRTAALIEEFAEMKLNCDLSHFVCVAERLRLGKDIISACADRALHLDARVGHEEGPQVFDPRSPRYELQLEAHLEWWDEIWASQRRRGLEVSGCMPEFGPPPYQATAPDGSPIGNLEEINDWMAGTLRERFAGQAR